MSRLNSRVDKLEQSQSNGCQGTDWADAEVKAGLFKKALREWSAGDVNAMQKWSEEQSHERKEIDRSPTITQEVRDAAAAFRSKIAAMATRSVETDR
jgi:hypothetical protein